MADPILRGPKVYTENGQKYQIKAVGGLHKIFSLTGDIDVWRHGCWQDHSGGCIHEELLKHWPELAPLAALHLSNQDGVPMHALGNGFYWLAGAMGGLHQRYHGGNQDYIHRDKDPVENCLRIFAEHVRISIEDAAELREQFREQVEANVSFYDRVYESKDGPYVKDVLLKPWIEAQLPRWKAEAEACIKEFGLKVYT